MGLPNPTSNPAPVTVTPTLGSALVVQCMSISENPVKRVTLTWMVGNNQQTWVFDDQGINNLMKISCVSSTTTDHTVNGDTSLSITAIGSNGVSAPFQFSCLFQDQIGNSYRNTGSVSEVDTPVSGNALSDILLMGSSGAHFDIKYLAAS